MRPFEWIKIESRIRPGVQKLRRGKCEGGIVKQVRNFSEIVKVGLFLHDFSKANAVDKNGLSFFIPNDSD